MNALFISSFIFSVVTSFVIPGSVSPAPDRLNARYPIEFCGIAGSGDVNCYSTTSTDSNIIAVLSAKTSYEFSCRTADGESIDGDSGWDYNLGYACWVWEQDTNASCDLDTLLSSC